MHRGSLSSFQWVFQTAEPCAHHALPQRSRSMIKFPLEIKCTKRLIFVLKKWDTPDGFSVPALRRWRWEDQKFKVILGGLVS